MRLNRIAIMGGILVMPGIFGQEVGVRGIAVEAFEGKTVTGSPYTAKAVTTVTQTLADGNRITNTTEILISRDSAGRTRREQKVGKLGPWETGEKGVMVTITDPVSGVNLVLMPNGQTAMKTLTHSEAGLREKVAFMAERHEGGMLVHSSEAKVYKSQPEDLGEQIIEGVRAKGQRVKITMPAGQIGNERPLDIVHESWYSPDLQTVVLSKRSDPRVGDTEYRLTNIQRVEPPASLFTLPAGYTIRPDR